MVKFFISIGAIDKRLIIPLIYIILVVFMHFYWEENYYNQVTFFIEFFGCSLGEILSFFLGAIFRYRSIPKKIFKKPKKKNYFKDFSILFLIRTAFDVFGVLFSIIEFETKMSESSRGLYINDALETLFITLITHFILKYKYYNHHFISIALITIFYLAFDLVIDNFRKVDIIILANAILYILADSLIYSYFKYLIEFKYYYFLDILSLSGIMDLFLYLSSFSILLLYHKLNDSKVIFFQFYELYNESGIWSMVSRFLYGLLFNGFCVGIMEFLMLYYLTPNFIIISYAIGRIPSTIYFTGGWQKWAMLILSILQTMSILFYLEILEFNFCNLNINTKRNISKRGMSQAIISGDDEIVIEGYDFTEAMKNQVELPDISEEKEEEDID